MAPQNQQSYAKGGLTGVNEQIKQTQIMKVFEHYFENLGVDVAQGMENLKKEIGIEEEQKLFDECRLSKGKPIKAIDHYIKLLTEYKKIVE
jgi:glutaredoxin-related protein